MVDFRYTEFLPWLARWQFTRFAPILPPAAALLGGRALDVEAKRPAVVLSVMQTSSYYQTAYSTARHLNLPFALVVHDDPEEIEQVRSWALPAVRRVQGRIYRDADIRFCVSPQLRDLLADRYGVGADVLYPNRSASLKPRPPEWNRELRGDKLKIGYAGTIAYGYGRRLTELVPIFHSANVTLRVYSLQEPDFTAMRGVEYAGPSETPDLLWKRVTDECDAVILPYCRPEHGHEQLYRTHFPSKLPEYLALGMPVIVTGPSYATGMQWANENKAACICVGLDEEFSMAGTAIETCYRSFISVSARGWESTGWRHV